MIRKRLTELATAFSKKPGESSIRGLFANERLRGFFSRDVVLNVDLGARGSRSLSGRDEVLSMAMAARTQLQKAELRFLDATVSVEKPAETAKAHMTALGDLDGEKNAIVQELRMRFVKEDGRWVVAQVDTIRTLK